MTNNETLTAEKKRGLNLGALGAKEKKLLGGVAILGLAAGSYMLISDQVQKNQQLNEENATIQTELNDKRARANTRKKLDAELKTLNKKAYEKANQYYGTVNQGEFIFLIDDFINRSEITLKKVSFAETTELNFMEETTSTEGTGSSSGTASASGTETVSSSSDTAASSSSSDTAASSSSGTETSSSSSGAASDSSSGSSTAEAKYENTNITQMTASIEFEGTYTQIIKLLNLIDENDKTIVSSELSLDREDTMAASQQENPPLAGTILLRFYQVEDVERYVTPPASKIDQTPIPFAAYTSPFNAPNWLKLNSSEGGTASSGTDSSTNTSGTTTDTTSSLAPSYLEQLQNSAGGSGLSAYFNTSTVYKFESALELNQTNNGTKTPVTVDSSDFKEGTGSNVVNIPASSSATHYEMRFTGPEVSLNSQPDKISFAMSLSSAWKGETGIMLENASGETIYLKLDMDTNWTGWREVSFTPENIANATYPLKIRGFYFRTPSGSSGATTVKLDNLAVHYLVTN